MKKFLIIFAVLLASLPVLAQRKSVSILGDSYSTFEGFVEPASNELWYFATPDPDPTDVDDVKQTW